jgi:two-component system, NtrC family, nitrogen regulation sensor histidine kinase GlnL
MALPGSGLIRLRRGPAAERPREAPTPAEIMAAMATAVLVIDPDGKVVEINAACESLFNLSRSHIVGRAVFDAIGHPLDSMPNDAPFAAYDIDIVLPGQRRMKVDLMVAPLPDRLGWRTVSIHAHARSTIGARSSDRESGTRTAVAAAAMLAHEIKNPLSAVRGAAQLLETTCDEDSRDLTRLIREEVDRVAALIDRMQGFTDTRPIEMTPQNIHAILGHAREVALKGFAKGRTIREIYDPSLPAVLGHRDSLIQILINLLKNAAEAMGEGPGAITLTTAYRHGVSMRRADGNARQPLPIELCVIDEGPGAQPDIEGHLFDPFVTTKRMGSGLGLALVDKLVSDQGGIIEYAREGMPPKTVFRLLLPRARVMA